LASKKNKILPLGVLFDLTRVIALAIVEDEYDFCNYPLCSISSTFTIGSLLRSPHAGGPHHVGAYIFLVFLSKVFIGVDMRVFIGVHGINFHTMIRKKE